jgi:ActR/RegA family two-component response regulator
LGDRPDEPQLPLYCIASSIPISAIAFAEITNEGVMLKGLASHAMAIKGIKTTTLDWLAQIREWEVIISGLIADFVAGKAVVDPKNKHETCQYCDLQVLCRVSEVSNEILLN